VGRGPNCAGSRAIAKGRFPQTIISGIGRGSS
jgi:hypothetical protein